MNRAFKPPRPATREPSVICVSSDSEEERIKVVSASRKRQKNNQSPPASPQPGPSRSSPLQSPNKRTTRRPRFQSSVDRSLSPKQTLEVFTPVRNGRNGGGPSRDLRGRQNIPTVVSRYSGRTSLKRERRETSEESQKSDLSPPAIRHSERPRKPVMRPPSSGTESAKSPSPPRSQPQRHSTRTHCKVTQMTPSKPASITGRMTLSARRTQNPSPPGATPPCSSSHHPTEAEPAPPERATVPVCVLCDRDEVDRVRYFRMDSQGDLHAHYTCMFTASNLHQTGDPRCKTNQMEICGFLCQNVRKERNRSRKLWCKYCKKRGAAVGCAVGRCSATYHYPCGVENGCYFQFSGSFESYCPAHVPKTRIPRPTDMSVVNRECVICLEEPELTDRMNALVTPCCHRALHRLCLSEFAVNAGKHYIKCPSCNIVEGFRAFCDQVGVHVPNADATWLADEEAERVREDQEEGDQVECAAGLDHCMCPNGLVFDEDVPGRDWNIERCTAGCGTLMHAACMKHVGKKGSNRRNFCFACFDLEIKINKQLGRRVRSSRQMEREEEDGSPEIPERPISQPVRNSHRGSRR